MLNVFFKEEGGLGFTFNVFSTNDWAYDLQNFKDSYAADAYLRQSKIDLLIMNLEHFVIPFRQDRKENKTQLRIDSEENIYNALMWAIDNKEKYNLIMKSFLKLEPFITTLVNELEGKDRELAFVMKCILMTFIRSEASKC